MNAEALSSFFYSQSTERQKLGVVDCVHFVTEAVFIGWNRDFRSVLQYNSRRTAIDRLRELCGLKAACSHALGQMHCIDDLSAGDVVWFDNPATIGLLMPGYVAVKMGKTIHRFQIEDQMTGWKTHGC